MKTIIALTIALATATSVEAACEFNLEGNDALQYSAKEMVFGSDCDTITITLDHTGKLPRAQMGHNVVVTSPADFNAVAQAGMRAGVDNGYVVPGDERVLAQSELIGGGESTTLEIDVSGWDKSADYTFFCSFPGHFAIMNGALRFE